MKIERFTADYRFLSNFYIELDGSHVEREYQAQKCLYPTDAARIMLMSLRDAKVEGRRIRMRPDWESVKIETMRLLVWQKFVDHSELKKLLLATGKAELIEGNYWGDRFWGVSGGYEDEIRSHVPFHEFNLHAYFDVNSESEWKVVGSFAKTTHYRVERQEIKSMIECNGGILVDRVRLCDPYIYNPATKDHYRDGTYNGADVIWSHPGTWITVNSLGRRTKVEYAAGGSTVVSTIFHEWVAACWIDNYIDKLIELCDCSDCCRARREGQ